LISYKSLDDGKYNEIYEALQHKFNKITNLERVGLDEVYMAPYLRCLRYHKTYMAFERNNFWPIMKRYMVIYVVRCLDFQMV